ncbi:ABC transporter permease [Taklimakanibacter lacteus]|uniref:ABC transporter permease n=1 Tax=Taklimakanibacter lacteus TaxID=2268456 RepID=UPI000E6638F5
MTDVALDHRETGARALPGWRIAAIVIAAIAVAFAIAWIVPGGEDYPSAAIIPFAEWIGAIMQWIKVTFTWLTRGLADIINIPLQLALGFLAKGYKIGWGESTVTLPRFSWVGVCAVAGLIGYRFGGMRLALLSGLSFLAIALFRQWDSAMLTLALILVCVPICVATGLLIGIWGYLSPSVNRLVITPMLDLMQTIPTFAYLIPMLLLFGNSPVSALLATGLFATPPMVRATVLGLSKVPQDIKDFADMAGCTRRQKLWRVLVPSAKPSLMLGVNQVIMLALNMVIISSMIGAGGLGYDVLLALRALKVGQAMEAGLAIVILAIVLDRVSQAAALQKPEQEAAALPWHQRHFNLIAILALLIGTTLVALALPAFAKVPTEITLTTAPAWKAAVDWVTVNYFDIIEVMRTSFLIYVLNPLRAFFEGLPWLGVALLLGFAGYRLGALPLAIIVALLASFCAVTGLWVQTMATLYLCGAAAFIAALIGIPIGLWASRSKRVESIVTPVIDTLQTIPSFCFIIPVVMLFRVGDVTALIATVAFAIVPAIRYTNHGIRQVPHELIEAGIAAGCTKRQLFWRVQLPVALPEIMLGINQTILLSLSMIVICAMIGTRDLGQEVFKALSKADAGKGIVAGLAIAFIGIIADRLITAWVDRMKARRGLA